MIVILGTVLGVVIVGGVAFSLWCAYQDRKAALQSEQGDNQG
jgi:hypothetical protein